MASLVNLVTIVLFLSVTVNQSGRLDLNKIKSVIAATPSRQAGTSHWSEADAPAPTQSAAPAQAPAPSLASAPLFSSPPAAPPAGSFSELSASRGVDDGTSESLRIGDDLGPQSPVYRQTLKDFLTTIFTAPQYFNPDTKVIETRPNQQGGTPLTRDEATNLFKPTNANALIDPGLYCRATTGAELVKFDALAVQNDFGAKNAEQAKAFLSNFAFFSKITTRMRQFVLDYESYLQNVYPGNASYQKAERKFHSALKESLSSKSKLPEFMWGTEPFWGPGGKQNASASGDALEFDCQESSKTWYSIPPQPMVIPGFPKMKIHAVRPTGYIRAVVLVGEQKGKMRPLVDIKGVGFSPFSLYSPAVVGGKGLLPVSMRKLSALGHASGVCDLPDAKWEFTMQKYTQMTFKSKLFMTFMQGLCRVYDDFIKTVKPFQGLPEAEWTDLQRIWQTHGVEVGERGGCPLEIETVVNYGVMQFGELNVANHYGGPVELALLIRQVTSRAQPDAARIARGGSNPEEITLPMNKYALIVQMALFAVGGITSLSGFGQKFLFFNLQADAKRTRFFDFGHFRVYANGEDGKMNVQGRPFSADYSSEELEKTLQGTKGVGVPSIAETPEEIFSRVGDLITYLTHLEGAGELQGTASDAQRILDSKVNQQDFVWWPGHREPLANFAAYVAKNFAAIW